MDRGGRIETGKRAEDIALDYLAKLGLELLERNWRSGHKELDLIMKSVSQTEDVRLHIIEVRSLRAPNLYSPYESIDINKQRMVISAARSYIFQNNIEWETQFDIVSVIFKPDMVCLEYIPDAFAPKWR